MKPYYSTWQENCQSKRSSFLTVIYTSHQSHDIGSCLQLGSEISILLCSGLDDASRIRGYVKTKNYFH
jgi:hypothetical protein